MRVQTHHLAFLSIVRPASSLSRVPVASPCSATNSHSLLLLLSPAKTLDFKTPLPVVALGLSPTVPACAPHKTELLVNALAAMTEEELGARLKISPTLAALNAHRFKNFAASATERLSLYAYNGDVFQVRAAV